MLLAFKPRYRFEIMRILKERSASNGFSQLVSFHEFQLSRAILSFTLALEGNSADADAEFAAACSFFLSSC